MPHRTEYETQRETLEQRVDDRELGEKTAAAIEELCDALDPEVVREPLPDGENHRAVKTLDMYTRRLRLIAERFDGDLTATRADALNEEMQRWYDGRHPDVGNDGVTRNTISNYQGPLRVFYRYHNFGIDPDDIDITAPESSPIDSDDMLDDEELQEIRNYIDSSRDRMIFELLLNTGLRNTAARTIRLTNLELEDGAFHLNEEADGLKGAAIRGTKRPLLGAEPSVSQWLSDHPTPGNPDAYLITNEPDSPHLDPTTPVSHTHLGKVLRDIKDGADVDKPLHPHALRHNFVTRAKRDHGMDDATIKYLIGHPADSSVMERTYQHISAETHVEDAMESAGGVTPPRRRGFTPKECTGCGATLEPGDVSCSTCSTKYSPVDALGGERISTAPSDVAEALIADEELKRQLVPELADRLRDTSSLSQGRPSSSRSSSDQ